MSEPYVKHEFLFNDFDEYAKFIRQADIEQSQLSQGSFTGKLNQLIHGPIIISHHQMDQKILQRGAAMKGYTTFLIPGNMKQDFIWRKSNLKGNVIGILHEGMEHDCITPYNFIGYPISIENTYLFTIVQKLGYAKIIDHLYSNESVAIDKFMAQRLHQLIMNCFNVENQDLAKQLDDLLILLIKSFHESIENNTSPEKVGIGKIKTFSQARDFIHAHTESTILVSELCTSLGVSERSLRYAFELTSGLSPKKYINHCRLNRVRSDLKSGGFEKTIEVAHRYGYWHTGQFAADYLKLFGELPSKTLKNA